MKLNKLILAIGVIASDKYTLVDASDPTDFHGLIASKSDRYHTRLADGIQKSDREIQAAFKSAIEKVPKESPLWHWMLAQVDRLAVSAGTDGYKSLRDSFIQRLMNLADHGSTLPLATSGSRTVPASSELRVPVETHSVESAELTFDPKLIDEFTELLSGTESMNVSFHIPIVMAHFADDLGAAFKDARSKLTKEYQWGLIGQLSTAILTELRKGSHMDAAKLNVIKTRLQTFLDEVSRS